MLTRSAYARVTARVNRFPSLWVTIRSSSSMVKADSTRRGGDLRLLDEVVHLDRAALEGADDADLVVGEAVVAGGEVQHRQVGGLLFRPLCRSS